MSTKQLSRTTDAADHPNANPINDRLSSGTSLQVQSAADRWTEVRRYFDMASKFAHATLACQVMTGFHLLELKAELGITQGARTDNFGHDARSWEERIEAEGKISRRTANRFMEMADALKPKLARMKGEPLLRELIKTSPADWSEDDSKKIFKVLEEVTSGKTQGEFLCEIGAAKKPKGLAPGTDPDQLSAADILAAKKTNAEMTAKDFIGRLRIHYLEGDEITHLTDETRNALLGICIDVNHRIRQLTKGRKKKRGARSAERGAKGGTK